VDFFARQDQTRRATRFLVVAFGLAFLAVALATTIVAAAAFSMYSQYDPLAFGSRSWVEWATDNGATLAAAVAAITGAMVLASLYRAATLARGGGQVARMLGATEIHGDDSDPLHQRLINVVEEMAIASGLPVPEIYVLEREPGINAFAAGLTHADAAVAVTRGALERLNRAELQGVIAHEFSHILNGDMRLNQRLIGYSFGILVLSLMGRWLLRGSRFAHRSRNRGMSAALVIGLGLTVIGGIGVLLSRAIKAAVSRQRETLADASAVQFTREPAALAAALKKIGGFTAQLSSVESEEVAHMLFGNGRRSFSSLFATHPPLIERIRALDPTFQAGDYPNAENALPQSSGDRDTPYSALAADGGSPQLTLESVGRIESAEVGAALRTAIPEELYHAAHNNESSFLLVIALASSSSDRSRQSRFLESRLGAARTERCERLRRELARLDRRLWLPLLELCAPSLKQRPTEQLSFLFEIVGRLTAADDQLDLFEYVLLKMLAAFFPEAARAYSNQTPQPPPLSKDDALYTLLATVAAFGNADPTASRAAYQAGLAALSIGPGPGAERIIKECLGKPDPTRLDTALAALADLTNLAKRRVLTALLASIRHDRQVEIAEAELFRAIAASLGCPMPPAAIIR
jgi:Zn-dependent protease with chaperone function